MSLGIPDKSFPTVFNQPPHHDFWAFHPTFPGMLNHFFRAMSPSHMISPEVDIRETKYEYVIDISLPGVANKDSVVLECPDSREMIVSSKIERPEIPGWGPPQPMANDVEQKDEKDDRHEKHQKHHQVEYGPRFLLAERNVGQFHRTFTFPLDITREKVQAKLENGLLTITAPKAERRGEEFLWPKWVFLAHLVPNVTGEDWIAGGVIWRTLGGGEYHQRGCLRLM